MTRIEREVEYANAFKKDLKREMKGQHKDSLAEDLETVVDLLKYDAELPEAYQDHALSGVFKGTRELHIKPDLLLVYEKPKDKAKGNRDLNLLRLTRMGSHAELFGK